MQPSRHWLTYSFIPVAVLAGAFQAQAAIDPKTQTDLPEATRLNNYCNNKNMEEYEGQLQCLQETAGQTNRFVTAFHGQLFSAVGLAQDPKLYPMMLEKWDQRVTAQEALMLRTFHHSCGTELMTAVFMPQEILKPENPHTTAYNLSRYCLNTAIDMSVKYQLAINFKEATRLRNHLDTIDDYYGMNPHIPYPLRWGEQDEKRNARKQPVPPGGQKWSYI